MSLSLGALAQQDKAVVKKLKGLDKYIERAMKDWKVPGVAMVIVKDGKVAYQKGYGYRDVAKKLPVTPQTQFAIGSSSKAFTATTVCQLVDDGVLDLDKPLKEYLPDFKLYDDYVTNNMTARDLLCHRSGLPRHDLAWYGTDFTREELYKNLHHLEATQGFREGWQYQNLMFMTAGYLVGKLSGKSWEKNVQERIFNPLGMNNSNLSVAQLKKTANRAIGYNEKDEKIEAMPYRNIDVVGPAGSINSTVEDMAKWVTLQLNKGKYEKEKVVSAGMMAQMHRPHTIVPGNATKEQFYTNYGLGWFITSYRGQLLVHHGGNIDGFSALVAFLPQDKIGMVILTNKNATPITNIIRNEVVDRLKGLSDIDWSKKGLKRYKKAMEAAKKAQEEGKVKPVAGTKPSHSLKDYAGKYKHPAYGQITVVLDKGKNQLKAQYHTFDLALKHFHYDVFQVDEGPFKGVNLQFLMNTKGEVQKISSELQAGVEFIEFDRVNEKAALSEASLDKYLGEYELQGATVKVWKRKGNLMVTLPNQPDWELVALKKAHTFDFKDKRLKGYQMIFKVAKDKATEASFHQPNGVFTAKRK
ncbi:hypothetical protein BKI52_01145 [marine bacterium AO1-C]|nr:hypothetical protein BKI52_01145 [marine bacterium AO1-C]